jgi:hypothetical protein
MSDWRDTYRALMAKARDRVAAAQPQAQAAPDPEADKQRDLLYRASEPAGLGEQARDFASGLVGGALGIPGDIMYGVGHATGIDALKTGGAAEGDWAQNLIGASNPYRETLGGDVGHFAGGVLPFLAVGAPELAIPRWARMAGLGAASGFGAGVREAEHGGATPGQATAYGLAQGLVGAGYAIPAESLLGAASKPFLRSAPGVLAQNAAYGAAGQLAGNLAKQATFAPETDTTEGVGKAALAAGLGGGLVHAGIHTFTPQKGKPAVPKPLLEAGDVTARGAEVPFADLPPHVQRAWDAARQEMAGENTPRFFRPQSEAQALLEPGATDLVLVDAGRPSASQGAFHFDEASGRSTIFLDSLLTGTSAEKKAVFWHEVLHRLKQFAPEKFEALWEKVSKIDKTLGKEDQMRELVAKRLGIEPDKVTPEQLKAEGVNYKAEQLAQWLDLHLTDPQAAHELLTSKPAPILQLFDSIASFVQGLRGRPESNYFQRRHLERVLGDIGKAYGEHGIDAEKVVLQAGAIADGIREMLNDAPAKAKFQAGKPVERVNWGMAPVAEGVLPRPKGQPPLTPNLSEITPVAAEPTAATQQIEPAAKPSPTPKPATKAPAEPEYLRGPDGKRYTVTQRKGFLVRMEGPDGKPVVRKRATVERDYKPWREPTAEEVAAAMKEPLPEEAQKETAPAQEAEAAAPQESREAFPVASEEKPIPALERVKVEERKKPEPEKSHKKQETADPLLGTEVVEKATGKKYKVVATPKMFVRIQADGEKPVRVARTSLAARFTGEQIPKPAEIKVSMPEVSEDARARVKEALQKFYPDSEAATEQQNIAREALAHQILAMAAQRKGEFFSMSEMAEAIWKRLQEREVGEGQVPISPAALDALTHSLTPLVAALDAYGLLTAGTMRIGGRAELLVASAGSHRYEGMSRLEATRRRRVARAAEAQTTPEASEAEQQRIDTQIARLEANMEAAHLGDMGRNGFAPKNAEAAEMHRQAVRYISDGRGDLLDWLREQPLWQRAERAYPPDPEQGRAYFSKKKEALAYHGTNYVLDAETRLEMLHRVFLDEFSVPRRVRRTVLSAGGKDTEQGDFDTALTLLPGRMRHQMTLADTYLRKPLIETLKENNITLEEGGEYLEALHAEQRNELGIKRNIAKKLIEARKEERRKAKKQGRAPKILTADMFTSDFDHEVVPFSGLATSKAKEILARVEASPKREAFYKIRDLNRQLQSARLDMAVRYGLLSQKKATGLRKKFGADYVPMRDPNDANPTGFTIGARGRYTRASMFIERSFDQLYRDIIKGENNLARQAVAKFFLVDNPDTRLWKLFSKKSQIPKDIRGKEVSYWDNGKIRYMAFADPMMVRALKRTGVTRLSTVTRTLGTWSRLFARLNTAWNPEFLVPNLTRDVQTAFLNMSSEGRHALVRNLAKDVPHAIRAMWDVSKNFEAQGEWHQWARRFKDAGGETGWAFVDDMDTLKKHLEKEISTAKTAPYSPKRAWELMQSVGGFLERAGNAAENGTRLAIFRRAVESGMSEAKAAALSKRVTVDFNRRGEMTPMMNALWTFFNANLQGTARTFAGFHKDKKKLAYAASLVAGTVALASLNRYALSDVDDDGVSFWDKKSDWEKSRELIIMLPGTRGRSINIPMPWGWALFGALGNQIDKIVHTGTTGRQFAGAMWQAGFESFNPMGSSQTLSQFFAPTILDPFVQIGENVDFAGRPVAPVKDPYAHPARPNSERFFSSVSPAALATARFLNRISGGDALTAGAIDWSPEWIELMTNQVLGGAGMAANKLVQATGDILHGDLNPSNVPVLRRFSRGTDRERLVKNSYYEHLEEVSLAQARVKEMGDAEAASSHAYKARFQMGVAQRRITVLNRQLKAAQTDAQRERLQGQIVDTMRRFNMAFSEAH